MTAWLDQLATLGPILILGTTIVLGLGSLAVLLTRSPIHRQRLGELTIASVFLWIILAVTPLPRLVPQLTWSTDVGTPSKPLIANNQRAEIKSPSQSYSPARLDNRFSDKPPQITKDAEPFDFDRLQQMESDLLPSAREPVFPPLMDQGLKIESQQSLTLITKLSPNWSSLAARAYVIGAMISLGWLLLGHLLLLTIRWRSNRPEAWLQQLFDDLSAETTHPRIQLLTNQTCRRAMSWGAIWPVIVLPAAHCQRKNESQLRMVLMHELGHTVQGDAWGNLLLTTACPLLYPQPLFWWLRSQIRLCAELVADDFAAGQTDKETYVLELIALAKSTSGVGVLFGATGVMASPTQFYRRMQMLIAREAPLTHRPTAIWRLTTLSVAAASVMLAAASFGIQPAVGQSPQPTTDQPINKDVFTDAKPNVLGKGSEGDSDLVQDPPDFRLDENRPQSKPTLDLVFVEEESVNADLEKLFAEYNALYAQQRYAEATVVAKKAQELKPADPAVITMLIKAKLGLQHKFNDDLKETKKPKEIVIRGADGKEVEIIIEIDGETSHLIGNRFTFNGIQFLKTLAEDPAAANPGAKATGDVVFNDFGKTPPKTKQLAKPIARDAKPRPSTFDPNDVISSKPEASNRTEAKIAPIAVRNKDQLDPSTDKYRATSPKTMLPTNGIAADATAIRLAAQANSHADQYRSSDGVMDRNFDTKTDSIKNIDLVSLATAVADAVSATETATDPDATRRATRKADLLLQIVRIEIKSAAEKIQRLEKLQAATRTIPGGLNELQSRKEILTEILSASAKTETVKPTVAPSLDPEFQ